MLGVAMCGLHTLLQDDVKLRHNDFCLRVPVSLLRRVSTIATMQWGSTVFCLAIRASSSPATLQLRHGSQISTDVRSDEMVRQDGGGG